jgi:hypothetical protein
MAGNLQEMNYKRVGGGKGKGIRVTGRGAPQGCETLRFPRFLDNEVRLSALWNKGEGGSQSLQGHRSIQNEQQLPTIAT